MQLTIYDKIYWLRAALGALTGTVSELLFGCRLDLATKPVSACTSDYQSGILLGTVVFLGSYYLVRAIWGKKFEKSEMGKLYTTGLGSYVLLFLFLWILLYTLGVSYLSL